MGVAELITDEQILPLIRETGWSFTSQIQDGLSEYPPKVVMAKLKQLKRRGIITGCACGCRGDWERVDSD